MDTSTGPPNSTEFTLAPAQELPVERLSRLAGELAHPAWRLRRTPRHLYTPPRPSEAGEVVAHHRELPARAVRDDHVWFGFQELCEGRTSVTDYLAAADRFPTVVLDAVPPLTDASPDGRRTPTWSTSAATATSA
ncbi:AFG1/ZapE family ATPase [Kitasatospora sp. NPDC059648]|uniref:AFG1/ZapE family ATPase n=1 Tax=Kitasatospora sp. NPDC059648 TaxID=3346894 RepID=UPI0036D0795E